MSDAERICETCMYCHYDIDESPCVNCAGTKEHPLWEPFAYIASDAENPSLNLVHTIIDEAMEKRDRTVAVFISGKHTSVLVSPLDDEPRWIKRDTGYEYSVCGCIFPDMSRYCSNCGEALKVPSLENAFNKEPPDADQ